MSCTDCNSCYELAAEQPPDNVEFCADGVFVKQMLIARAGTFIPQHSHKYDHMSMLATGSVEVWKDGAYAGQFVAPYGIFISAGVKHLFRSLEDNTIIYCIHNTMRGPVEIAAEHNLVRPL